MKTSIGSIVLTAMIVLAVSCLHAQVSFGFKAGLSSMQLHHESINLLGENGLEDLAMELEKTNLGVNFGLFVMAKSKRFFIMPELTYNSNSVDYKLMDFNDPSLYVNELFEDNYQFIDFPLMLGLRFKWFRIGGGPVGHYVLKHTSQLLNIDGYAESIKDVEWGYQAGIGLDFLSLSLDVRYENNFSKFGEHLKFNDQIIKFDQSPSRILATLGISF